MAKRPDQRDQIEPDVQVLIADAPESSRISPASEGRRSLVRVALGNDRRSSGSLLGGKWFGERAGAQSVITTLWAVSDVTSTAVMRRFYEHLAAGEDVASALARSKATVLEQFGDDARATVAAVQLIGVGGHRVATAPQKTSGSSFGR